MQISRDVCGFTGGEADTLRKAIGKKKIDVMKKMQVKFIDGAVANGVPKPVIEKFWKDLLGFADYCFNKSHSACYGMISYWTAYIKAHYPAEFMAALMTSDFDDTDRLAIEIAECKHMGIDVLPPDVNESFAEFAVVPGKKQIRFGMNAIKNVGTNAVEEIIRARNVDGKFTDLEDFLGKVNVRIANRKTLESLVKSGGFDRMGDRSELLHNLEVVIAYAARIQKEASSGQTDLFGMLAPEAAATHKPKLALEAAATKYNQREQLLWERELLGLYLSQDPLEMFATFLEEQTNPINELKQEHDGKQISVGGSIIDMREITTKKGQKMAFVKIEDQFGEIELILFPGAYQTTAGIWERDKVVLARGKVNAKDRDGNLSEELKVMVDDAREITAEQAISYQATGKKRKLPGASRKNAAASATPALSTAQKPAASPMVDERIFVRLADSSNQQILMNLKQIIDSNRGDTAVVLVLGSDSSKQIIKLPGGMSKDVEALGALRQLVGAENVKTQ